MLLAVDVGNTSVTLGLFRRGKLASHGRIPTHPLDSRSRYSADLRQFLKDLRIEGVILSSVVPKATGLLQQALRGLGEPKALVVGEDLEAPVINRYRVPAQVGQDRLVNAAAAFFLYRGPAIVVDFGTAITIDLVTRRREYLGGLIVPGIEIALEALGNRAALLPRIALKTPREFLGRDTISSIRSGIFYGYGALCDGIVQRLKRRFAPSGRVIATGGYSTLLRPYCRTLQVVNPFLTLQGLELTYRKGGQAT